MRVQFVGQTDPKGESQRIAEGLTPIRTKRHAGRETHDGVQQVTESPRRVTVCGLWRPVRCLRGERGSHVFEIENIGPFPIQRRQARTVGEKIGKCDPFLPRHTELRPEFGHRLVERNACLLKRMQRTGRSRTLRRRPAKDERVCGPRLALRRIAPSAAEAEHLVSVLPHAYLGADFLSAGKVILERRPHPRDGRFLDPYHASLPMTSSRSGS